MYSHPKLSAETLSELRERLTGAIEKLTKIESSVASVASGCELFLRFITLTSLDHPVSRAWIWGNTLKWKIHT